MAVAALLAPRDPRTRAIARPLQSGLPYTRTGQGRGHGPR